MSINTRVGGTSESVMDDVEVHHERHPNHLLWFYSVGCVKEVINLINHPVVSLFGSRVSGAGASVVVKRVYGELFATKDRERKIHQSRYC